MAKTVAVIRPTGALSDLREFWAFRELLYFFVWRDVKVRYKQTVIGAAWAVIQPFSTMIVFSLFFGKLAKIPSGGVPYPVFYYSALVPWTYFANALQNGTNTMIEHQLIITKVYFPRVMLPMASVLGGLVDFSIAFVVLVGMGLYFGIAPTVAVLVLPAFALLAVATAFGVSLWLSALNAVYRDVRYAVPFMVQLWLFASPVAYPTSLVPARWQTLYGLNPMAGVVEGFRWAFTGTAPPQAGLLAASAAAVVLLIAGGLVFFQHMQTLVADVV